MEMEMEMEMEMVVVVVVVMREMMMMTMMMMIFGDENVPCCTKAYFYVSNLIHKYLLSE